MRKIIIYLLLSILMTSAIAQSICKIGMQYEKSTYSNWAEGYPVVINVLYNSSAYKSGIKVGDIITSIDGIDLKELTVEQINQLIKSKGTNRLLGVKDFRGSREVLLIKDCHRADAVSEAQLAQAFSFYSLRDVNDRRLVYPITTKILDDKFSFNNVKTFSFINATENAQDSVIYRVITRILEAKGLTENTNNPDIKVDIFYSLKDNPDYIEMQGVSLYSYRYDFYTQRMDRLPIMNMGIPKNYAKHTISFGINILDNHSHNNKLVWSSQIEDLLSSPISIDYYASNTLPLMLRGFPFIIKQNYPRYLFSKRHYNYTGIRYQVADISHIVEVDDKSVAYNVGIRAGDIIRKINGVPIGNTDNITADYITFIKQTDRYREPISEAFTDANGIANCRYWAKDKFSDIANVFATNKYNTPFSYLFFFREYINPSNDREIVFEIERNNQIYSVIVKPEQREYVNITVE